jgi:Flp pilus assembly protein TadD
MKGLGLGHPCMVVVLLFSSTLAWGLSPEATLMAAEARALAEAGDRGGAAIIYRRALAIDPSDPHLHAALTDLLMQEAQSEPDHESEILQALEQERSVSTNPALINE